MSSLEPISIPIAGTSDASIPNQAGQKDIEKSGLPTDEHEVTSPPSHAIESLERWNSSNTIRFRYFVTLFDMFVLGMNDAAVGALVPYVHFTMIYELAR